MNRCSHTTQTTLFVPHVCRYHNTYLYLMAAKAWTKDRRECGAVEALHPFSGRRREFPHVFRLPLRATLHTAVRPTLIFLLSGRERVPTYSQNYAALPNLTTTFVFKMPFVKQQKNGAYYSRYQTKYRRRREGKTDYQARRKLVSQAKDKYNAPKYRLVVRFSNKYVTVQIISAKIQGDAVLTHASSRELPRYGIKHGLSNWAAAYATGLLCARRALTQLGLADKYEGVTEPDGTMTETEPLGDDEPRPFKCFLDVGLKRTSTGSRVFAALKGASDGGVFIPHSEKRFPGYDAEAKELDSEILSGYIRGSHVAEFMESLEEEDDERFKKHFARYLADDIGSEDLEEIYDNAFEAIREDPSFKPSEKSKDWKSESKKFKAPKLTYDQRKQRIADKIAAFKAGQDQE